MRPGKLEQAYEDVLQNLEFGVIQVFRQHPELCDWDVLKAITSLIGYYNAAAKGKPPRHRPLRDVLAQQVYDHVLALCEWRLGRGELFNAQDNDPVNFSIEPLEIIEIVACLKRIKKSVNFWTKKAGRQGYVNFTDNFFPRAVETNT